MFSISYSQMKLLSINTNLYLSDHSHWCCHRNRRRSSGGGFCFGFGTLYYQSEEGESGCKKIRYAQTAIKKDEHIIYIFSACLHYVVIINLCKLVDVMVNNTSDKSKCMNTLTL